MTTTEHRDMVSVITDDHRAVERVFLELEDGSGDPQRRRNLADHVIELADQEISEHAEAERVTKDLDPTDPQFDQLLGQLMSDIRHHVEDEENDLLPKLQSACSEQEVRDLGDKVLRAKETAPTRPPPSAPDKPPANLILDPGAGLIDKLRDGLTGRSDNT